MVRVDALALNFCQMDREARAVMRCTMYSLSLWERGGVRGAGGSAPAVLLTKVPSDPLPVVILQSQCAVFSAAHRDNERYTFSA